MLRLSWLTLCLLPGAILAQDTPRKMFANNCMSCHQPPDPTFATDRAWLNEIKSTA